MLTGVIWAETFEDNIAASPGVVMAFQAVVG
jgi:hypothetical protein